jgi:hypothetical protein
MAAAGGHGDTVSVMHLLILYTSGSCSVLYEHSVCRCELLLLFIALLQTVTSLVSQLLSRTGASAVALYDFDDADVLEGDLPFSTGDTIQVLDQRLPGARPTKSY